MNMLRGNLTFSMVGFNRPNVMCLRFDRQLHNPPHDNVMRGLANVLLVSGSTVLNLEAKR